ncbi:MAG: hypothetical protein LC732_01825, partial [Acidobacteria bacterium]|nr:hypothetical protein [Acidobacteriota bacterium]
KDSISAQLLGSKTEYPSEVVSAFGQPDGSFDDLAAYFRYRHNSRNWVWGATYNDIGSGFRADSGFIPQVGYRAGNAVVQYTGRGEKDKHWYTRWFLGADYDYSEKENGELLEEEIEGWAAVSGPLQSFFRVAVGQRDRRYNGVTFDEQFLHWVGEASPTGDLSVYAQGTFADQIDFANTRPGERFRIRGGARWNIGIRTRVELDYSHEDLEVEGGRLFVADVTALKAIYHFNIRTFVRAILQYTDVDRDPDLYLHHRVGRSSERLFPQLLFSYKLNPQTVFFAGYSGTSLGGTFGEEDLGLTEANRTFFVKLGYAWLF